MAGYLLCLGDDGPDSVDWEHPIATASPGATTVVAHGVVLVPNHEYWLGIAVVSNAGVTRRCTDRLRRVMTDSLGHLVGDPPNPVVSAIASPLANGKLAVRYVYAALGSVGVASQVQLARLTSSGPDWGSPLATAAVRPAGVSTGIMLPAAPFEDGELVSLAIRAVTQAGVAGPWLALAAVVADRSAPNPPDAVLAAQEEA